MSATAFFRELHAFYRAKRRSAAEDCKALGKRIQHVFSYTWDLGLTAFGGPPVHFGILHRRFVDGKRDKPPWIDEQTYQELFAVAQALPGPSSTKMLFCIALGHAGLIPALIAFLMWSLPGAIGMFGLSLGVQNLPKVLPSIVYALLSGLNASTVGIVALAAVQLATNAITDRLSRILVILGACAGLCYSALWYFPFLITLGGLIATAWDLFLRQQVRRLKAKWRQRNAGPQQAVEEGQDSVNISSDQDRASVSLQQRTTASLTAQAANPDSTSPAVSIDSRQQNRTSPSYAMHAKWGLLIIVGFCVSFAAVLVARSTIKQTPFALDVFSNFFLAGTIIFGGGPVVIPLLRQYCVDPGWVSSRDFLLGLALIQAFPGPNFNFAVYLAALAFVGSTSLPAAVGAVLGYVAIFAPGIVLAVGFQSVWHKVRKWAFISSVLRGVNATAVGLVFTAVYRLWSIGYLTASESSGQSLGEEPFWLVVSALSYAETAWFAVPPPVAIIIGGLLGLCWYGVVGSHP